MKITKRFLKKIGACRPAMEWGEGKGLQSMESIGLLNLLIKENKLQWANWLIVRVMAYKQYVSYAIFAAEQVIDIYEKKYPGDKRPRLAIEAAKKCIENPSEKNKAAADAAADELRKKILKFGISLLEAKDENRC